MRVLVCGGRDYKDIDEMFTILDDLDDTLPDGISCIISGGARGADDLAIQWAQRWELPFVRYDADWQKHGRAAGPIRNQKMLDEGRPDVVIAFPGGRGTADMVSRATAARVRIVAVGQAKPGTPDPGKR